MFGGGRPFLVAALKDAIYARGLRCGAANESAPRTPEGFYEPRREITTLPDDLFAAGRDARRDSLLFHANHHSGWRDKCRALRNAAALHVANESGNDACDADPRPTAASGVCAAPS